jgi:hypothetical protein
MLGRHTNELREANMADVLDQVPCPQCGNAEADFEFCDYRELTMCSRCGYWECWDPQYDDDDDKCCGWNHEIRRGAGALWCQPTGGISFTSYCFNTKAQVRRAGRWLCKQLDMGTVEADTAYLTRWNSETKKIELVIGASYHSAKLRREGDHVHPDGGVYSKFLSRYPLLAEGFRQEAMTRQCAGTQRNLQLGHGLGR